MRRRVVIAPRASQLTSGLPCARGLSGLDHALPIQDFHLARALSVGHSGFVERFFRESGKPAIGSMEAQLVHDMRICA